MSNEGLKKTTAKATNTDLLEAEAKGEKVRVVVNGVTLEVNPKAITSGPALRAMQQDNNIWPMYELMVPNPTKRAEFENALPQDPEFGWDMEDFAAAFGELFEKVAGKKA